MTNQNRVLRWALPLLVIFGWLAVGAIGGSLTGKLAEVQRNDNAAFLPAETESTEVSRLQRRFAEAVAIPAVVVVEADQPLTEAQLGRIQRFAAELPALPLRGDPAPNEEGRRPVVGDFLVPGEIAVIPAEDGRAAMLPVPFDEAAAAAPLPDGESPLELAIGALRAADDVLAADGSRVYLTGPAGSVADLVEVFAGIDGVLLLVATSAVLIILLLVYRSPVLPLLVILSALLALALAGGVIHPLADRGVLTLNGQSQGILFILVVGAATDYALLLISRYREELRRQPDRFAAMARAWRRTLDPVLASGGTVILGLLCLLLSDLESNQGLGPVGAIGIAAAMLSALTLLPALLLAPGAGRWVFWPRVPAPAAAAEAAPRDGGWQRLAGLISRRSRAVWVGTALALLALCALVPTLKASGVPTTEVFLNEVESVTGQQALARHFPAGATSPTVIIGPADEATELLAVTADTPGVQSVQPTTEDGSPTSPPREVDGLVELQAVLADPIDSAAAEATVASLRERLDEVSQEALVGGSTAMNLDLRTTAVADRNLIIPVVLVVIFFVLAGLLRSLIAPLLLIAANVLSFGATLGAAALVFNHLFDFPGADPSVPLYGFVFLVALGIDYSIFLMTRVREESMVRGTRSGVLVGLTVTGGVITSAGVVLAATFTALGVLPLLFLVQIAFIVAFGVLLDTLVVRSLLVPALVHDLGARVWWPSALAGASPARRSPG